MSGLNHAGLKLDFRTKRFCDEECILYNMKHMTYQILLYMFILETYTLYRM